MSRLARKAVRDGACGVLCRARRRIRPRQVSCGWTAFNLPTRYPNGFDAGAPTDFYTADEAADAVDDAEAILDFCRDQIG